MISAVLFSCKKETTSTPPAEPIEDDLAAEATELQQLHDDLTKLETGELKSLFDTGTLKRVDKYIVLFKSSFQKPLVEEYTGDDDGKEKAAMIHERNAMVKLKSLFTPEVLPDTAVHTWYSILSMGFAAVLTDEQAKEIYRSPHVKLMTTDFYYNTQNEVTFNMGYTHGHFIHGYKSGEKIDRTIWVLDEEALMNRVDYHASMSHCKQIDKGGWGYTWGHGTRVSFVAAGYPISNNNFKGLAYGGRVGNVNTDMSFSQVNAGLEYIWIKSKKHDIVNCSFGVNAFQTYGLLVELENNILDFNGWGVAFTIAAGNEARQASTVSPARLGLLFKQKPFEYLYLYVVAAVAPEGNEASIKNRTCSFKMEPYSNYGAAVRMAMIGTWQMPDGSSKKGTSFSAPALAGILYHNQNVLNPPKYLPQRVSYTFRNYKFTHPIGTLYP